MTLWIKVAVVTSVCMLLYFGYTINKIDTGEFVAEVSYLAPITIPMPLVRKDVDFNKLVENLPTDRQFFRQVFFEIMNLRGMQKNRFKTWLAIFADGKDNLICIGPGDTYDGVKIESSSESGCTGSLWQYRKKFSSSVTCYKNFYRIH